MELIGVFSVGTPAVQTASFMVMALRLTATVRMGSFREARRAAEEALAYWRYDMPARRQKEEAEGADILYLEGERGVTGFREVT
jgi:hypothetical protein